MVQGARVARAVGRGGAAGPCARRPLELFAHTPHTHTERTVMRFPPLSVFGILGLVSALRSIWRYSQEVVGKASNCLGTTTGRVSANAAPATATARSSSPISHIAERGGGLTPVPGGLRKTRVVRRGIALVRSWRLGGS